MNEKLFEELLDSVRWMGKHMRGEKVSGRVHHFPDPDVQAIRRAAKLSQAKFASLIGVNVRTLQNWEQKRVRPTGPARALLRIVEANPKALAALHAPRSTRSSTSRNRRAA
jgi:putative transcriptional regulator